MASLSMSSEDLTPDQPSMRDRIEERTEEIVESLGPEGYLILTLLSTMVSLLFATSIVNPLLGLSAELLTAIYGVFALVSFIGFVRVLGTFDEDLKTAVLCHRLGFHKGHPESYSGGEITVFECERCGELTSPIVTDGEEFPDHPENPKEEEGNAALIKVLVLVGIFVATIILASAASELPVITPGEVFFICLIAAPTFVAIVRAILRSASD